TGDDRHGLARIEQDLAWKTWIDSGNSYLSAAQRDNCGGEIGRVDVLLRAHDSAHRNLGTNLKVTVRCRNFGDIRANFSVNQVQLGLLLSGIVLGYHHGGLRTDV